MTSAKPYSIAKHTVWEAYRRVKANRGSAGIDDETIVMFEQDLSRNLYKLWNRLSSGSYFPPPVRQEKSKLMYCKDSNRTDAYPHTQFTFLGFTFRPRQALSKQHRLFTSFLPGVSDEAVKRMRQTVRGWRLHNQTPDTLEGLARQCNPTIRGWWNYYGAFY